MNEYMMTDTVSQHVLRGITPGSQPTPLFPDIGVIAFVPEEWGGIWMSRHQILTRLAQYFHVVWAEPAREWRELWFGDEKKVDQSHQQESLPQGLIRYQPGRWLPRLYRPASLASWTATQRVRRATALLRQRGCKTIVFYLWRPNYDYVLDCGPYDLSCYHIVDEYSFSPSELPLDTLEVQLIKRVNQVFIHSPALLDRKGHFNAHTRFVPNGVNYRAFSTPREEPDDLRSIPHPRIGYVGNIKAQLNFQILLQLATRHPEWSLVFVGPKGYMGKDATFVDQLSELKNVYFLGNKAVEIACAYPQHMDVCVLPYVLNDYTRYIYPLKLHEYLAGGRPVVGAPIRSLESFNHIIRLAGTEDEWSAAIEEALQREMNTVERIDARRTVARNHDWEALVATIAGTMCERLGPEYQHRFHELVRPNAEAIAAG